ncbi:hypothetical protein UlMin_026671 [Ulmus minor]
MASVVSMVGVGLLSKKRSSMEDLIGKSSFPNSSSSNYRGVKVVVKAEAQPINPDIRKTEEKVVDSVVVTELSKNLTPYCRCWRSATFPLCNGSHVKHNKETGDNVGPLLLKKQ